MPDVIAVSSQEELEARRLVWKSLLVGTRAANVCHTIDWIHLAFEHHYPQEWRILFVYSGRQPVGILPLTINEQRTKLGTLRILGYPSALPTPSLAPIGPNPTATLAAAMRFIEAEMDDWDILELGPISPGAHDHQRTPTAMRMAGMEPRSEDLPAAPTIALSSTDRAVQRHLSEAVRESQASLDSEFGHVQFQRFRPAGELFGDTTLPTQAFDKFHGQPLATPDEEALLLRAQQLALRTGFLDFARLQSHDETLASSVAFFSAGQLAGLRIWVSPKHDFERISQAFMERLICDSTSRGDDKIAIADERIAHWTNSRMPLQRYSFIRRASFRVRAANWLARAW